jgi:predicted nucleic acid-binding protein
LLPAPVIAEIQEGIEAAPSPARRIALNQKLDEILRDNPEVIVAWDSETARTWGRLKHSREVKLRPQSLWDSLIDAMGVRYDIPVATRNKKDFRHARIFNPWTDSEITS